MNEETIKELLFHLTFKDAETIIMSYLFERCFHCNNWLEREKGKGCSYFYYNDAVICFDCLDKVWLGLIKIPKNS